LIQENSLDHLDFANVVVDPDQEFGLFFDVAVESVGILAQRAQAVLQLIKTLGCFCVLLWLAQGL
jgi:hypothetical protein